MVTKDVKNILVIHADAYKIVSVIVSDKNLLENRFNRFEILVSLTLPGP